MRHVNELNSVIYRQTILSVIPRQSALVIKVGVPCGSYNVVRKAFKRCLLTMLQ